MMPLNQFYQRERTLRERRDVRLHMADFEAWAKRSVQSGSVGRSYDVGLAMAYLDVIDRGCVLELGARDSFFGVYLTAFAEYVVVSDVFGDIFHGLGGPGQWFRSWSDAAPNRSRLACASLDMRDVPLDSESFDVIVNLSAIEHVTRSEGGDSDAAREMGRLLRPGGVILLSTDVSDRFRHAGGFYYDADALHSRLIEPSGCALDGPVDFDWGRADRTPHKSGEFEKSCAFFALRKPWK